MKYEITYLVESEEKSKVLLDIITSTGATSVEIKNWGLRDLAYTIDKHTKARYYTAIIDTIPSNIVQIKKKLNFSEASIRYLIIKQDE